MEIEPLTGITMHWVDGGAVRAALPSDPNILPLGHYLLFAMADDIPSVARIVTAAGRDPVYGAYLINGRTSLGQEPLEVHRSERVRLRDRDAPRRRASAFQALEVVQAVKRGRTGVLVAARAAQVLPLDLVRDGRGLLPRPGREVMRHETRRTAGRRHDCWRASDQGPDVRHRSHSGASWEEESPHGRRAGHRDLHAPANIRA